MSAPSIQAFLNSKVPTCDTNGTQIYSGSTTRAQYGTSRGYPPPYICLKSYTQNTPSIAANSLCGAIASHSGRTAAQMIMDVSLACGVSPKVIIVTLQKEEALVTDDWPWPSQYRIAMGYGCPDTSGCDSTYYGFFNQVYNAAKQFKRYRASPTSFNYIAGQNNRILYNPNAACGSSIVYIQNQATAGLYDYTPYRPNAAALSNLYGTGDSCSAYGNRNFWRYYNDWFGPTLLNVVRARSDDDNPTQYVIYDGKKQGIPSTDVLSAWNINSLPLQTYSASALANIPDQGTVLSRYVRSTTSGSYYFVDGGKYYSADNATVRHLWYSGGGASTASSKLFGLISRSGALSPYFSPSGSSTIAMIDGVTQYLPFAGPSAMKAWMNGEHPITLSTQYFNRLTSEGLVENNRITSGGADYVVVNGRRYSLPSGMSSSYPFSGSEESVSSNVVSYFTNMGNLSRFIKSDYSGSIYLLNNGVLRPIASPELWYDYASGGSKAYSNLGKAAFDLVPQGSVLRTAIVKRPSDNTYYVLNGRAHQIPSGLLSNYSAASKALTLDTYYFGLMSISAQAATPYVTSSATPAVFLLDNATRLGISNPITLTQLLKPGEPVTLLTDYDLKSYTYVKNIRNYLGSLAQRYFIDRGTKHPTTSAVASDWGLGDDQFTAVSTDTLNHFDTSASQLSNIVQIYSTNYLVSLGRYFTVASPYAGLWNIPLSNNLALSGYSVYGVKYGGALNRFASNGSTIYTTDNGKLIGVGSLSALYNLGYSGQPIASLSDGLFGTYDSSQAFNGYLAKNGSATCYILDKGYRRQPTSASHDDWCYDAANSTLLSDTYLNLLPNGSQLGKSFRASGSTTIYAIDNGTKRWIPNNTIYYNYFAPFSSVYKYLRDVLPTGAQIGPDGN